MAVIVMLPNYKLLSHSSKSRSTYVWFFGGETGLSGVHEAETVETMVVGLYLVTSAVAVTFSNSTDVAVL